MARISSETRRSNTRQSACCSIDRARKVSKPGSPGPAPTIATSPRASGASSRAWRRGWVPRNAVMNRSPGASRSLNKLLELQLNGLNRIKWRCDPPLASILYTNLFVGEIAAGILLPGIPCHLPCPHTSVAVADGEKPALGTAPLEWPWALAEAHHQRISSVAPDLGERPFAHAAQVMVPPKGIGMHMTEIINIGDVLARGVAAPVYQSLTQCFGLIREMLLGPQQQERAIGIVVAGDILSLYTTLQLGPAMIEQTGHGVTSHAVPGILFAVAPPATAVVEVRKVELVDLMLLDQRQYIAKLRVVLPRQGKTQPHLDAALLAQFDCVHGFTKGALALADDIVGLFETIDADADVVVTDIGNLVDIGLVDQSAVGGEPGIDAQRPRPP